MKKFILVTTLCLTGFLAVAQDTIKKKQYNNEFGFDATPFIKQFLNFSQTQFPEYYTPTYYLTYRRFFANGDIRAAIGASFANNESLPSNSNADTVVLNDKTYSISARVGWEWFDNLGKRWQVFYGIDFLADYQYNKGDDNEWETTNTGNTYFVGVESTTQIFGLAPILGIRLKLTKRLSLLTETSYSLNWEQDNSKNYYILTSGQGPTLPDSSTPTVKKLYTSFSQPVSLFVTFRI
jgi:hypothetical protein